MTSTLVMRSEQDRSRDSLALEIVENEAVANLTTGLARAAVTQLELEMRGLPDGDRHRVATEQRKGQYEVLEAILGGDIPLTRKVLIMAG